MKSQENKFFWWVVEKYNSLMLEAIRGPDCTDPEKCKGDCCSIKIDVPKVLAKEYIKRGYASKEDFIRSDNFSFQLRFDEGTGKCFLFNKAINGCKVHLTKIKPLQCFIYPTNFANPEGKDISCKSLSGWKIIDSKKTYEAEKLLENYIFLSKLEAKDELKKIKKRIRFEKLKNLLRITAPSSLGGFKDSWEDFELLHAEGLSLQMKKFCLFHKKSCKFLPDDFFECKSLCNEIMDELLNFLRKYFFNFVMKNGPDISGEYPLYKLFGYAKNFIVN
ncbi:MAG: hypothetical protein ACFE85_14845 [Candidatus Hodarchaeota archaeon]